MAAFAASIETSVAHIILANIFEAAVASAPLEAWPAHIAAGIEGVIRAHPRPLVFINELLRQLTHLIETHIPPPATNDERSDQ
jgi:hypothetical protein